MKIIYKLKVTIKKTLEKLMPLGTHRRNIGKLGISAIRVIRYEGWRSFWLKARKQNFRSFFLRPAVSVPTTDLAKDSVPTNSSPIDSHPIDPYEGWIIKNEPTLNSLGLQKQKSFSFKYRPKISIIMPTWNSEKVWLKSAIESVIKQTYDNWELCIADGGSTKQSVKEVLNDYSKDPRIRIKYLSQNKGIAGNSNEALSLASGEYIALLDHDDELAPFALYEVARALNDKPELDLIYSDQDYIVESDKRIDPLFKPDWSPDLFLSFMYIGHLSVFRKTIVDMLKGFRLGYDGSQDYDFVLRFIEKTNKIFHIPKILYHWRKASGSVASDENSKPYAYIAAKKALSDFMQRNGILGDVIDGPWLSSYRLHRQIIGNPLVSIIIASKDRANILKSCVESILEKTEYHNFEIIIVDNQSSEEKTFEYYKALETNPKVTILHCDKPFNFSEINNYAALNAKGEHFLFLNNDTEVISGEWLSSMLEHSQRKEVGVVGAQLLFRDKTIQHCGVILGLVYLAGHPFSKIYNNHQQGDRPALIGNYSAVTGACMMIRKSIFNEVGGFDTRFAVTLNDIDLCLRIRKQGYLVVYTPYAQLYHDESLTRGYPDTPEKQAVYQKEYYIMRDRWGAIIDGGDPYYNPNLTLEKYDFSLKL